NNNYQACVNNLSIGKTDVTTLNYWEKYTKDYKNKKSECHSTATKLYEALSDDEDSTSILNALDDFINCFCENATYLPTQDILFGLYKKNKK
ncbi:MAG: hypothetical protein K2M23_03115, partial [Alphaproteobacteria bacterium]|nr:hypothetical protein [Alphaproteobacteria bacterium]